MSTEGTPNRSITANKQSRPYKSTILVCHVLLSVACVFVHTALFAVAQLLAICLPVALGLGTGVFLKSIFDLSTPSPSVNLAIYGGILASLFTLIGTVKSLRVGLFGRELAGVAYRIPEVEELVRETCEHLGTIQLREIRYIPGSGAMTLHVGSDRVLIIGMLTIKYLTKRELAAVIAHECGHHHGGAMLPNRIHYRAFMFFCGFAASYRSRIESYSKASNGWYGRFADSAQFSMLTQLLLLIVYSTGVQIIGWFLNHPEYEFYCDRVAADALGANTVKSALRKLNDLAIAQRGPAVKQASGIEWIRLVDGKYINLRTFNSRKRYENDNTPADTHPSLAERILRLDGLSCIRDDSEPLDTEANMDKIWMKIFDDG